MQGLLNPPNYQQGTIMNVTIKLAITPDTDDGDESQLDQALDVWVENLEDGCYLDDDHYIVEILSISY